MTDDCNCYEVHRKIALCAPRKMTGKRAATVTNSSVYNLASAFNRRRLGRMTPRSSKILRPVQIASLAKGCATHHEFQ